MRAKDKKIKIISAGAGSGKTYRLTQEMVTFLQNGDVQASGIIATTFTNKAAAELQERVRVKLLEEGLSEQADELTNALIGTVHGLGVKLLKRFAFEAGVSPDVDIMADEDQQVMFNQSLAMVLSNARIRQMETLADRLGLNKKERYDWRKEVKTITDIARSNDFDVAILQKSKRKSFDSLAQFFVQKSSKKADELNQILLQQLNETIETIEANSDTTKTTQTAISNLKTIRNELQLKGELRWHQWVKIAKTKVGAKSRDDFFALQEIAWTHDTHPLFHQDIQQFIEAIFDIAIEAIQEYEQYKKKRGLIDYVDMELLVKRLLNHASVQEILTEELDLLMVDEFQDTSPIQLEIFYKLSRFATHAVWVGDPKQSIYGFRGADPKLMQAIITQQGGIDPKDIQEFSWRSREDIVFATNAIFCKAFPHLDRNQIKLQAKRCKRATENSANKSNEPIEMNDALMHWHFESDSGKRTYPRNWFENAIAHRITTELERKTPFIPKGSEQCRPLVAGDIAILCRSNAACQTMAEALHRVGLKAAISRAGLLQTAEAKLIIACLKYFLNEADSLSIAEIMLLASQQHIESIIENRLQFLEGLEANPYSKWGIDNPFIQHIQTLRKEAIEFSSSEILNLLLEELDLRRIIASWGNTQQRFDNIDVLRKFALQYEDACNRLHTAASLGGFLLWLNELSYSGKDVQGAGESPNAIRVLTYHKSKGLEYPMVILHSMEGKLRDNIWGVHIEHEQEGIDLDNILGHRWLRYWINPYSDQIQKTPLLEKIEAHSIKQKATQQALAEEARLLYVGITRARDYLVFPSRQHKPTKWLNRVWHNGQEDYPTLDGSSDTPWEWEGQYLQIDVEHVTYGLDFEHTDIPPQNIKYLETSAGQQAITPLLIDETKDILQASIRISAIGQVISIGTPLEFEAIKNTKPIAKAQEAFLVADRTRYTPKVRIQMANTLLERYEITEVIEAQSLVYYSSNWQSFLVKTFQYTQIFRKFPIQYFKGERLFTRLADLVLQKGQKIIFIHNITDITDNKSKRKTKIHEKALLLEMTKQGLAAHFQTQSVDIYVHFILEGALMKVETTELTQVEV